MATYPKHRMRRRRNNAAIRKITRETSLSVTDFIYPIFVTYGKGVQDSIEAMPGISRVSIDNLGAEVHKADIVAPSAMMDGQVAAIRSSLDQNGYIESPIMAYSAKYASGFYGPFREAAMSAPSYGDRQTYQLDTANTREAMEEIRLDVEEGADIIMVKPALAYLDVISAAKSKFMLPIASYNTSGEYTV